MVNIMNVGFLAKHHYCHFFTRCIFYIYFCWMIVITSIIINNVSSSKCTSTKSHFMVINSDDSIMNTSFVYAIPATKCKHPLQPPLRQQQYSKQQQSLRSNEQCSHHCINSNIVPLPRSVPKFTKILDYPH